MFLIDDHTGSMILKLDHWLLCTSCIFLGTGTKANLCLLVYFFRTRVVLKKSGEVLDLVPPPTKVHNLIFGRTWVDSPGEMLMTNQITRDKVVLYLQPCGWFGYVIIITFFDAIYW